MNKDVFDLKITSKEGVLYEGQAQSISSFNEKGKFDVLAQHANFISLIEKSIQVIDMSGELFDFPIQSALMRVNQNNVRVYVGIDGLLG